MSSLESVRVREVGMRFGIGWGREGGDARERVRGVAEGVEMPGEGIVLITGASGSGKTTLLRALEERLRAGGCGVVRDMLLTRSLQERGRLGSRERDGAGRFAPRQKHGTRRGRERSGVVRLERMRLPGKAVVDCFGGTLEEAVGWLCRAGLAEARVWLRMPGELSEGERFRFRLARWMAGPRRVLVADEFCNGLDRITARGVAWQLRRFVAGSGRVAVVATAHEDLAGDLGAVRHIRM